MGVIYFPSSNLTGLMFDVHFSLCSQRLCLPREMCNLFNWGGVFKSSLFPVIPGPDL
jgi:hypothetical protein